jgi:hypothetical protein
MPTLSIGRQEDTQLPVTEAVDLSPSRMAPGGPVND